MPYIKAARRPSLHKVSGANNAGELNYEITTLVCSYLDAQGMSYGIINEIRGALLCASDEFYRRVAVPYENTKLSQNGDVY